MSRAPLGWPGRHNVAVLHMRGAAAAHCLPAKSCGKPGVWHERPARAPTGCRPLHRGSVTTRPCPLPLAPAAVENDDRGGYFSTADLLPLHAAAGVPIVFDFLHHALLPGGLGEREALLAALATWPEAVRPVVHYRWVASGGRVYVGSGWGWGGGGWGGRGPGPQNLATGAHLAGPAACAANCCATPRAPAPAASRARTRRWRGARTATC